MSSQLQKDAAAEGSISRTLYKQLFIRPSPFPPGLRLDGKTAIVTGANSGLGFEAARQLLRKGLSHLIVAVRSEEKGEAAIQSLRYEFPDANIALSLLDLGDYESIIAFVSRCGGVGQVDYIILNAGVQRRVFERNQKTGHETVLQINFLSTALLAMMLASQLKKRKATRASGNPPVLTVVGSDTMYFSKLNTSCPILSLMDEPSRFAGFQQYMDTKLMLMMFVALLAERYRSEDIVINVCNPGMTYGTNLGRDSRNSGVARYIIWPFVCCADVHE
ncbi:hypothetical protein HFD88_005726 [Aspergillus terreus]|nr:hypothetical protein HFD88_005726 [Aspergillus terreus]